MSQIHTVHELSFLENQNLLIGQGGCKYKETSSSPLSIGVGEYYAVTALTENVGIVLADHEPDHDWDILTGNPVPIGMTLFFPPGSSAAIYRMTASGTVACIAYRMSEDMHI